MARFRTIEIDFDVHKRIEAERKNFDETDNDALRRLLGLGEGAPSMVDPGGEPWVGDGVRLPNGTGLRMKHLRGRQLYEGAVRNGKWVVAGRIFDTPSGAASALAVTSKGGKTNLNGWGKWEAKLPGELNWVPLTKLRQDNNPIALLSLDDLDI